MKVYDCAQGSLDWFKARLGKPTSSKFGEIVTPTGKATTGKGRYSYAVELAGERLTGQAITLVPTYAMQRGTDLEPWARDWYVQYTGIAVRRVGFVGSDCDRWGCSPDGLTEKGGIEIKCPGRVAMLTMIDQQKPAADYILQMQGCMFVTGATEWDFVLYSDESGMPCTYWTVKADAKIQDALAVELPKFCAEVDEIVMRIKNATAI